MIRACEERKAVRAERQQQVESSLWSSLTAEQRRLWLSFSNAVAQVQPAR